MSNSSNNSKSHFKRSNCNRDRDKNKSVSAIESGATSQCDTPPLNEKEPSTSQGKYAGISPESVHVMAEQIGAELTLDASTNLAEDVSYKLRQVINTIALQSELLKKSRVDTWDVNSALKLMDTGPVVGMAPPHYASFGDEKLCCAVDSITNITECATTTQTYVFSSLPTISVEWITDERSLADNSHISLTLQNYYTKVSRAILNLKKKPKQIAVEDLTTNTRIGPIFPNLFNLAVLVLNDDNLNALNVPAKKPLQSNVLDMVDALCSNPCSLDTNIQQQFQRLFPVMVSNILGNGSLAEKMVAILTKITRTWPSFVTIGKGILFDYLSQGTKERLTGQMIKCVVALGRQALVECLADHLDHIDVGVHAPRKSHLHTGLREAVLEASTCLLKSELTTFLEDYVVTDYTLYEMLGDSIMPRRLLFPATDIKPKEKNTTSEKPQEDDFTYVPIRPVIRRSKIKILPQTQRRDNNIHREELFEPVKFNCDRLMCTFKIRIAGSRPLPVNRRGPINSKSKVRYMNNQKVVVACGLLNRFRFRLPKESVSPIFGPYVL